MQCFRARRVALFARTARRAAAAASNTGVGRAAAAASNSGVGRAAAAVSRTPAGTRPGS